MPYEIRTNDGIVIRNIPDDVPPDAPQLRERVARIRSEQKMDPTEGMSGTQKFLAGAGKAFSDIGRGAGQLVGAQSQEEIDEAAKLDKPLMETGAGIAGNIAGNAAAFAPTAFIPGANTYMGAGIIGGALNAAQPVQSGQSRGMNAAMGAAGGMGGQFAGNMLGRAIRPVASRLGAADDALAGAAQREGIPLTSGQLTGSQPLKLAESVMESLPATSGRQIAGREAQQRAFTAAALRRTGIEGAEATPEILGNQRNMLGNQMRKIAEGNTLDFYHPNEQGKQLINRLDSILIEAEKRGKTASEPVRDVVMNIVNEINEQGVMSGKNYQAWRQMLRPLAKTGSDNAHAYGQLRSALDEFFNAQVSTTGGAQAWKDTNRQYANLKTVMQAVGGPGNTAAGYQVPPSQLAAALRQSMGKEGVALGRGDMNELSRIGTKFVRDQIPDSGTAQRQFYRDILTGNVGMGGIGTLGGAGLGYASGDKEGAMIGAAAGAGAGLAAPRLAQALMQSPAGRAYLERGIMPITQAQRKALTALLRTGGMAATPALME